MYCVVLILLSHFLLNSTTADEAGHESIGSILSRVAGVYRFKPGENVRYMRALEKTVVVTGCNRGYLNHLLNFKCFADRLGMKFVVFSFDQKTHDFIRHNTTMESIHVQNTGVTESSVGFRSKQFNLISARKMEAVHDVLKLGYDVLFSDTDVAILRDPFPYLLWKNVDYVHSLNVFCKSLFSSLLTLVVLVCWHFSHSHNSFPLLFLFLRAQNQARKIAPGIS